MKSGRCYDGDVEVLKITAVGFEGLSMSKLVCQPHSACEESSEISEAWE